MKTWKNRNRRSKKHKQRGGVKYTVAELKPKVDALLRTPRFLSPVGADIDFKVTLNILKGKLDGATTPTIELIKENVELMTSEYDKLPPAAPASAAPAPAPATAAPVGTPVWPMNAPAAGEGQPTSISNCSKMLADARAEIAALKGRLAEEAVRMAAENEALQGQLAGLRLDIEGKRAELVAAEAATAALSGEKGDVEAKLEQIRAELAQKLGELADKSALNDTLTAANRFLAAAGANKDATLDTLRGQLEGLRDSSLADIAAKDEQIRTLNAAHAEQLAETNRRYRAEAIALQGSLDTIQGESGRLTAAQQKQIKELQDQLTALRRRIEELTGQLTASQAATAKEAQEKEAAAAAAGAAAAAEAAKLDAVTRDGKGLRERLAAAEAAAGAADKAARDAVAAQGASADAAAAANRRVTDADAAAAEAARAAAAALADKDKSEGEKKAAQDAAAAAEAARAAAVSDAAARALEATAAQAAEAAANVQRNAIQASLDALKNSVPTIVSISGGAGEIVGGAAGRDARYDELLTVKWVAGAAPDRDTWVFVMFSDNPVGGAAKVPVYSQLLLNADSFTFTSTLSGPVQAVIYDVVSHHRGNGAEDIDF